jgi:hypothetical protein
MPLVAALALRFFAALQIERFVPRLAAGLMFTPLAISVGAITIAHANGLADTDSFARPAIRACFANASYRALARLPEGLVIADVNFGPYVLALTPHSVVGAPYHRLSTGIIVSQGILASAPDESRTMVNATKLVAAGDKPVYIVVCGRRTPDGLAEPAKSRSLWAKLAGGSPPAWLEPVTGSEPLQIYRVKL